MLHSNSSKNDVEHYFIVFTTVLFFAYFMEVIDVLDDVDSTFCVVLMDGPETCADGVVRFKYEKCNQQSESKWEFCISL